jgi:hypothetical protein
MVRMRNVSNKRCRGNQNTFCVQNFFFRKSCHCLRCGKMGHRWQYGTRALHLDTYVYKRTLTICNTHCSSTAIMATRTRLDIMLYVHWLSCYSCEHVYNLLSSSSWPFANCCCFAIKNAIIIFLQDVKKILKAIWINAKCTILYVSFPDSPVKWNSKILFPAPI